jgi:asparagine synthase (glutamine-hydrolysing)
MGAIFAVVGEEGDPGLAERLRRMASQSPCRGKAEIHAEGQICNGVQTIGRDASLAGVGNWLVAVHGYFGNLAELSAERGWRIPFNADDAARIARIGVAFEDLGPRLFTKLRGEWAILIWDRRERVLVAARDVVGCRPLFWQRSGGRLFLATEIRQVLAGSGVEARCNAEAVADIHLVRFPLSGRTVFDGVHGLPGGVARSFHLPAADGIINDFDFWSPPPEDGRRRDRQDLVAEVRGLIEKAVNRSTPERGAAVSLSGGMDSSSVWSTLASMVSPGDLSSGTCAPYSNVYPGLSCDEMPFIRSILEFTGVEGVQIDTSAVVASEYLDRLCDEIDHPHMPNALPVELVCEAAAADGHDVLLTGLGGDEWLGGTLDYIRDLFYSGRVLTALMDLWKIRLPARLGGVRRRIAWLYPQIGLAARFGGRKNAATSIRESLIHTSHRGGEAEIPGSWNERLRTMSFSRSKAALVRMLDHLANGSILEFIEQQGARHGLELRHPLLDLDLVEFSFTIEPRALINGRCHKWLMRRAMADRLPASVTERIETTVFNPLLTREESLLEILPPVDEWRLTRMGVADVDAIVHCLSSPRSEKAVIELIRLWWLEVFVTRRLRSTSPVV